VQRFVNIHKPWILLLSWFRVSEILTCAFSCCANRFRLFSWALFLSISLLSSWIPEGFYGSFPFFQGIRILVTALVSKNSRSGD
jgi:hypothetical protein